MSLVNDKIRNVAVIAHIDHGKTTILDSVLKQSNVFRSNENVDTRVMDSNDQEKERGITIFSKNTSIAYKDYKINFVDTPGHADFAGEVERVLKMVNGVLLLVDATEGPMPQTRFVLKKAMELNLKPIVVINKIDRPSARIPVVLDMVLDLFIELGADEDQIEFPSVYASGLNGFARFKPEDENMDMTPLFDMIIEHIPAPGGSKDDPFLMQVSTLEYNDFLGKMGCGRILSGTVKPGQVINRIWTGATSIEHGIEPAEDENAEFVEKVVDNSKINKMQGRVTKLFGYEGVRRVEIAEGFPGDIVIIAGLDDVNIGDTISAPGLEEPLEFIEIDQPTLSMNFITNNSPFAGREGKHVTIRKIRERLERELRTNVSLRVQETDSADALKVSGRGELHLSVLIETMRREGYEMQISRPRVITKRVNGELLEPIEYLCLDLQEDYVGAMMPILGERRAELINMINNGAGLVRLEYHVPTRGLIGLRSILMNSTRGTGIMSHQYEKYDSWRGPIEGRSRGVLIAQEPGKTTAFSIGNLQDRATMFINPGTEVYEGMIVGENSRTDDMVVNIIREKKLTNMRASGSDDNIMLTPPRVHTLEQALEFIADDEFVEVTPETIRLRKRYLTHEDRVRAKKNEKALSGAGK